MSEEINKNVYNVDKNLLAGKTGLIMGVANKDSIAWHVAMLAQAYGADVNITCMPGPFEKRAKPLAESLGMNCFTCDVSDDQSIEDCFKEIDAKLDKIDFLVYGPAFANKDELKGQYLDMGRENFKQALDISCYSMIPCVKRAKAKMKPGSSVLCLSYHGSIKVIPCYDLMGIAKAALEANTRYLAYYLGKDGIRVNAASPGPIRTLAASRGIKGYNCLEEFYGLNSPMERNVTIEETAKACVYLLSDLSSGVTGEIHYIDNGYSVMGVKNPRTGDVDLSAYKDVF